MSAPLRPIFPPSFPEGGCAGRGAPQPSGKGGGVRPGPPQGALGCEASGAAAPSGAAPGLCRMPGWVIRLNALLDRAAKEPFRWGVFDCCLLAADSVEALTGFDPAAGLRGTYSDEEGARKILAREGGLAALVGRICRERGFREIPPLYAQRGDVAVVTVANPLDPPPGSGEGALRETAGLVSGAWVYCPKEPAGFVPVPLKNALMVFHVPFSPPLPKGEGENSAKEGSAPCPR